MTRLEPQRQPIRTSLASRAAIVIVTLAAFLLGYMVHRMKIPPYRQVESAITSTARFVWNLTHSDERRLPGPAVATDGRPLTHAERREMEALTSVAYLTGSRLAGEISGVTVHDAGRAYAGLNLVVSAHGSEVFLMDMSGRPLHTWRCEFEDVWPNYDLPKGSTDTFRRAYLYPNGDLLAIFNWIGLVKLDKESNLLWVYRGGCGNDLFVAEDGTIYVIGNVIGLIPRIDRSEETFENLVVVLDPAGEVIKRVSILRAFERSPYAPIMDGMAPSGDIFHTNTIEVLDGSLAARSPAFRDGNVLLSMRYLNTIAVLDPRNESIVWALGGRWRGQHQPTVLENGHMLLFNNLAGRDSDGRRYSEVLEFDPFSQEVLWSFRGDTTRSFYSGEAGSCQRLPNGNTLIVESDAGRVFEVAPDGTTVWEYTNPLRAAEDRELIATIFDLVRLPPDFPLDWAEDLAP